MQQGRWRINPERKYQWPRNLNQLPLLPPFQPRHHRAADLQQAIWFAAFLGLVGAMSGNRIAWPLLASLALVTALERTGIAFHPVTWALIDAAVVLAITAISTGPRAMAVICLFVPAWVFYFVPDPVGYYGAGAVVIAQFLIVFPARRTWKRAKETPPPCHRNPFDLRVIGA